MFALVRTKQVFGVMLVLVIQLASCSTYDNPDLKINLVWPQPPATARIQYLYSIHKPSDVGIRKGFFRKVVEFFAGEEKQNLVRPTSTLVTSRQILYVSDPGVRGVHRFDLKGRNYRLLRQKNGEGLPSPIGLAEDGDGRIFVSDSALAKLFVISEDQKYLTSFKLEGELKQPTGLTIDKKRGHIILADTKGHKIRRFDKKGRLISTVGQRGKKEGTFNFPTMVWSTAQGQLLVNDSLNFRVQKFDSRDKYIGSIGKLGSATGGHYRPKGIATDGQGHIYVVDALFHTVQVFDQKGRFLLNFGQQGQQVGEFWLPMGIYIDLDQKIYVADSYNKRVQVFRYLGGET